MPQCAFMLEIFFRMRRCWLQPLSVSRKAAGSKPAGSCVVARSATALAMMNAPSTASGCTWLLQMAWRTASRSSASDACL